MCLAIYKWRLPLHTTCKKEKKRMFGKKKSPEKKLLKQYYRLMSEGYKLSTINRRESDEKYAEADRLLKEIERIRAEK